MKKSILRITIFFTVLLICAFISWLGGYNFDKRNIDVATTMVFYIIIAVMAVVLSEVKAKYKLEQTVETA